MRKVWLICRKDLQEAFGQRPLILRPLIGAALMPFLLVYSIAMRPILVSSPVVASFLLFLAFGGSTLTLVTAATAIAGEKERRTSEALLAAPITDRDLFLGKALAAFLPGVIVGYLVQLLFAALVAGIAASHQIPVEISPRAIAVAIALVPLLTLLVAATGMMVSARSSTVLSAMQLGALVSLPVTGGAMYVAFKAMDGPPAWALRCLGLLLLIGVLLLRAGTRLVNREAIVSRM